MHSLLLLTAMTATSGLFGGGRTASCPGGQCGAAYYQAPATCAGGSCGYTYAAPARPSYQYQPQPTMQAPAQPSYQYQPGPTMQAPAQPSYPYPMATRMAPAPRYYNAYYYPPMSNCVGGNCPRR